VLLGAGLTAVALLLPAVAGPLHPTVLAVWLLAFGMLSSYTGVLVAHGKSLFPPAIVGRGMTLLNIGTKGGVFLSQSLTGAIINLSANGRAYPLAAYRIVFAVQRCGFWRQCLPICGQATRRRDANS